MALDEWKYYQRWQLRVVGNDLLKVGENKIEIKITNLWVNRLIGDAQPDVKVKTTFTTIPFHQANSPLLLSGLLSEVKINTIK